MKKPIISIGILNDSTIQFDTHSPILLSQLTRIILQEKMGYPVNISLFQNVSDAWNSFQTGNLHFIPFLYPSQLSLFNSDNFTLISQPLNVVVKNKFFVLNSMYFTQQLNISVIWNESVLQNTQLTSKFFSPFNQTQMNATVFTLTQPGPTNVLASVASRYYITVYRFASLEELITSVNRFVQQTNRPILIYAQETNGFTSYWNAIPIEWTTDVTIANAMSVVPLYKIASTSLQTYSPVVYQFFNSFRFSRAHLSVQDALQQLYQDYFTDDTTASFDIFNSLYESSACHYLLSNAMDWQALVPTSFVDESYTDWKMFGLLVVLPCSLVILVGMLTLLLALCTWFTATCYRKMKQFRVKKNQQKLKHATAVLGEDPWFVTKMEGETDTTLLNKHKKYQIHVATNQWIIKYDQLQLFQRLGVGQFGIVYYAKYNDQECAVKTFKMESLFENKEIIEEFQRETSIMASLRHNHIVTFLGACVELPHIAIVLEYCQKGSLLKVIQTEKENLSWNLRVQITLEIAKGLQYLHHLSPPILHRDLKSANILLDSKYTVKVSDFGFSRTKNATNRVMTSFVGSINYMAPEVVSETYYDASADIYSFSIIMFELLTLRQPYQELKPEMIFYRVKQGYRPDVPQLFPNDTFYDQKYEYQKLMQKCWSQKPDDRPKVAEIISFLEQHCYNKSQHSRGKTGFNNTDLDRCFNTGDRSTLPKDLEVCDNTCCYISRNTNQIVVNRIFQQLSADGGTVATQKLSIAPGSRQITVLMQVEGKVQLSNRIKEYVVKGTNPVSLLATYPINEAYAIASQIIFLGDENLLATDITYGDAPRELYIMGSFDGKIQNLGNDPRNNFTSFGSGKDAYMMKWNTLNNTVTWFKQLKSRGTILNLSSDTSRNYIYWSGIFYNNLIDEQFMGAYSRKEVQIPPTSSATFLMKIASQTKITQLLFYLTATQSVTFVRIVYSDYDNSIVAAGTIQGDLQCDFSTLDPSFCQQISSSQSNAKDLLLVKLSASDFQVKQVRRTAISYGNVFVTGLTVDSDTGTIFVNAYSIPSTSSSYIPFLLAVNFANTSLNYEMLYNATNGRTFDCTTANSYVFCIRADITNTKAYLSKINMSNGVILEDKLIQGNALAFGDIQSDSHENIFTIGQFSQLVSIADDSIFVTSQERREGFLLSFRTGCNCASDYCREPICYGKRRGDPLTCSSRGLCTEPNNCACPIGSAGTYCEQFVCNGVVSSDYSTVCSGKGVCVKPNICSCQNGYAGTWCELPDCKNKCKYGSCVAPNTCGCQMSMNKNNQSSYYYTGRECQTKIVSELFPKQADLLYINKFGLEWYPPSIDMSLSFEKDNSITFDDKLFFFQNDFFTLLSFKNWNMIHIKLASQDSFVQALTLGTSFRVLDITVDNFSHSFYVAGYTTYQRDFSIRKFAFNGNVSRYDLEWTKFSEVIPALEGLVSLGQMIWNNNGLLVIGAYSGSFLLDNCVFHQTESVNTFVAMLNATGDCFYRNTAFSTSGYNMALGATVTNDISVSDDLTVETWTQLVYGIHYGLLKVGRQEIASKFGCFVLEFTVTSAKDQPIDTTLWFAQRLFDSDRVISYLPPNDPQLLPNITLQIDSQLNVIAMIDALAPVTVLSNSVSVSKVSAHDVLVCKYDSQGSNLIWWIQLYGSSQQSLVNSVDLKVTHLNHVLILLRVQSSLALTMKGSMIDSQDMSIDCATSACSIFILIDSFGQIRGTQRLDNQRDELEWYYHILVDKEQTNNDTIGVTFVGYHQQVKQKDVYTIVQTSLVIRYATNIKTLIITLSVVLAAVIIIAVLIVLLSLLCFGGISLLRYIRKLQLLQNQKSLKQILLDKEYSLIEQDDISLDFKKDVEPCIVKQLGEGAFGIVYLVRMTDGIDRAAKIFKIESNKDETNKRKVIAEIQNVMRLGNCYQIIRAEKIITGSHCIGYLMPLAQSDLKTFLQEKESLSLYEQVFMLQEIVNGMNYLHERGYIHGDLKLENILMIDSQPKISDFDSVLRVGDERNSQRLVGTVEYTAPELIDGRLVMQPTKQSDIFSFGIVMLQVVNCDTKFLKKGVRVRLPLPKELKPKNNEWLPLIEACLQSDPTKRPSFAQIKEKLQELKKKHFDSGSFIRVQVPLPQNDDKYDGL